MGAVHIPVLLPQVLEALQVRRGGRYLDATVGGGGHAQAILEEGGRLLGLDADVQSLKTAQENLRGSGEFYLVHANFRNLEMVCHLHDFEPLDGVLFDLGLSSLLLEEGGRGFSFLRDEPLDMRYDTTQELTAAQLINSSSPQELEEVLRKYGEERQARRIVHEVLRRRPIQTSVELVQAVERATGKRRGRLHPATRTFLALRIATNRELENLSLALPQAVKLLSPGGRLVVLSYHSLEDRLVKEFLRRESRGCLCPPRTPVCICGHKPSLRLLTPKPVTPTPEEIAVNPRSRSAHLRAAERV